MDVADVEVGVGESKQERFLFLPGGLAIRSREQTKLKGGRLIVMLLIPQGLLKVCSRFQAMHTFEEGASLHRQRCREHTPLKGS